MLNKKIIYKISLSNVLKEIYFIYKISFECNYIKWLETKKENDIIKARLFCKDVEQLSKKYKLEYFFVTEGASKAKVEKCDAVKTAKEDHIIWKNQNNADSYDDWGKDDENFM